MLFCKIALQRYNIVLKPARERVSTRLVEIRKNMKIKK